MIGEMEKRQIMQNLFGDQSEDEKVESEHELSHQSSHHGKDLEPNPENEHQAKSQGEAELPSERVLQAPGHCQDRSSRSPGNEKGVDSAVISASVICDVFGDSDSDEKAEDGGHNQIDKVENSLPADKNRQANVVSDGNPTCECETQTVPKLKGKEVDAPLPLVFEIPYRSPFFCSDKMATFGISNIIGIDPKPFDPSTYVEENYYVTDSSGSKRRLPSTNIIRWRQVIGPDGKISVESNARFVTWSNGSLQLFIGKESFDVSDQEVKDIQSHVFVKLKHEKGLYQAQGRISRKMKFTPSSLSSSSHRFLAAMINSQNKKVSKVKQYVTNVDPEMVMKEKVKAEKKTTKADKQLQEKKKKVTKKYIAKGCKGKGLASEFLEDAMDKDHYEPQLSNALHHFELDQEKENAAEKRLFIAKKGPNDPIREKPELKDELKGKKAEGSMSHGMIKEVLEEHEEIFEDSEDDAKEPKARGMESVSRFRKQYIESDEESPPSRIATQRQMAVLYDSSEE